MTDAIYCCFSVKVTGTRDGTIMDVTEGGADLPDELISEHEEELKVRCHEHVCTSWLIHSLIFTHLHEQLAETPGDSCVCKEPDADAGREGRNRKIQRGVLVKVSV